MLAARELDLAGLPDGQRNWANEHTVYTHGYGLIAAYGNQRNTRTSRSRTTTAAGVGRAQHPADGRPLRHVPRRLPARIYFGENSPEYSIVGKAPRARASSWTCPRAAAPARRPTPTRARPASGWQSFRKLLYAVKFCEPNIVLSSRVNPNSKILYTARRGTGCRRSRPG